MEQQEPPGQFFGGTGCLMLGMEWARTAPLGLSLPAGARMSRPDLERWLHAHFLKLCLPYPRRRFGDDLVYAPLTMVTFFHIVAHVVGLGYPPHWLGPTLGALCSGFLDRTRARPPTAIVSDGKSVTAVLPPVDVCVAPFASEFRTLLALWEPLPGGPLLFESKGGDAPPKLPQRTEIRKFTITFPALTHTSQPWTTPSFALVFKAKSLKVPGGNLRRLLDDRTGDASAVACGARREPLVHVVSAFQWTTKTRMASFWMDEGLMESLRARGGWEAWVWRTDTWDAASDAVSLDEDGVLVRGEAWC